MPRRSTSPTMLIVNFFMSAPLAEAKQALDTAKAIVASREAAGLVQPALPGAAQPAKPRRRRERKPRQEALPAAQTGSGPVGVVPAAGEAPKPRRARRGRPGVTTTPAAAADAAPVMPAPGTADLSALPQSAEQE